MSERRYAPFTMVPNPVVRGDCVGANGEPISNTARALYALILYFSHSGKRPCIASQATFARHLRLSTRHVHNLLRELVEADLIVVRRQGRGLANETVPLLLPLPERKSASDQVGKQSAAEEQPGEKNGIEGEQSDGSDSSKRVRA